MPPGGPPLPGVASLPARGGDKKGPKPYKFIGFGALYVTRPYKFIGFGALYVTRPYKFIGFGALDVTKPYKFIGFGAPKVLGSTGPVSTRVGQRTKGSVT